MLDWLSHLDPNVVVGLVVALGGFVYHHLFSPSTQAQIANDTQQALTASLDVIDRVMSALVAAAPKGTTRADLEAQLWTAAKVQFKRIGLDPDKLPPAITQAVQALVTKYLAPLAPKAASSS